MIVIFDALTRSLSIDHAAAQPWGADVEARINRYGQVINLTGVEMRLTVEADGVVVFDLHLPPLGVRYRQTDQDTLATGRVLWPSGAAIRATAWARLNDGAEVTAEAEFTAPEPPPAPPDDP
jgi:hypothetical protein